MYDIIELNHVEPQHRHVLSVLQSAFFKQWVWLLLMPFFFAWTRRADCCWGTWSASAWMGRIALGQYRRTNGCDEHERWFDAGSSTAQVSMNTAVHVSRDIPPSYRQFSSAVSRQRQGTTPETLAFGLHSNVAVSSALYKAVPLSVCCGQSGMLLKWLVLRDSF